MDSRLIDILVCPVCKSNLRYMKANNELVCKVDRLAYPIIDDIPVMIENRARLITEQEVKKWTSE